MKRALPAATRGAFAWILITACTAVTDTNGSDGNDVTLTAVQVTSAAANLAPDDSVDLHAQGIYSNGSPKDLTDSVTWSSNAAAVSVSNTAGTKGRAKAIAAGAATVTASYEGKSGTVTVTALGVSSISVSPGSPSIEVGATQSLTAAAALSDNSTNLDVTTKADWTSSNTSVATVESSAAGVVVTGVGAGTAEISASWKGVNGQTVVTTVGVSSISLVAQEGAAGYYPIGGVKTFTATAQMSDGSMRDVTASAAWATSTSAFAISNTGTSHITLTRNGEDSSYVSATFGGATGSVLLRKACIALASGLSFEPSGGIGVAHLQLDGSTVLWFDYDGNQPGTGGAFRSAPTGGGTVTTIKSGLPFAGQWAVDADYIYWMFVNTEGDQTYRIVRMSRTSGTVDTLFNNGGLGGGARGLVVDASYIYYSPGDAGGVRRMPKAGGAATSFFSGSTFYPRWMSLDAGTVYGVDVDASPARARRVPTNGTAMDTLANANASFFSTIRGNYFYWSENLSNNGRIARVPLAGGTAETVASAQYVYGFVVTGGYVYFGNSTVQATGLYRQSLSGGSAELVTDACGYDANTPLNPQHLATDGTYVYLSDPGGAPTRGRILRVRK